MTLVSFRTEVMTKTNIFDRVVALIKPDIAINFLFMTSYLPEKHFHSQQQHDQDKQSGGAEVKRTVNIGEKIKNIFFTFKTHSGTDR